MIYTKTGDTGQTGLFGNKRISKSAHIIELIGNIDELNSILGVCLAQAYETPGLSPRLPTTSTKDIFHILIQIQNDLFHLGSACAGAVLNTSKLVQRIKDIEETIDLLEHDLPELRQFILPGGSLLAAQLHCARAVCRRVERQLSRAVESDAVSSVDSLPVRETQQYMNRLSDCLFMLARWSDKANRIEDMVWEKWS